MRPALAFTRLIFFFTLWISLASSICYADLPTPRFEAFRMVKDEKRKVVAFSGDAKWVWQDVGVGAEALRARIVFKLPEALVNAAVSVVNSSAQVTVKDGKLLLITGDLATRVNFTRSPKDVIQVEFNLLIPKGGIFEDGCQKLGIQFLTNPDEFPFYIGARCKLQQRSLQLQISFPSETDVEKSTIFDSQGKGESWKVYELGNVDAAQGELAKITLKYKESDFELIVNSTKKAEAKTRKGKEAKFAVGLGYDSMTFTSPDLKISDAKPVFLLKGLPYKLFWKFGLGIDLATAIGLTQSNSSISYLQIAPYGYLRFFESRSLLLEARGYFSISSQTHSASGGGYQYNQFGAGLLMGVRLSPNWKMIVESRTDSLGSAAIKSHIFADLQILRTGHFSWGWGALIQEVTVNETTSTQHKFSHALFYGLVVY